MTIGDRIKLRRCELNMSQDELAHRIGYKSRSSINKIEIGALQLRQKKIKEIATALCTTPAYIMGWEDKTEEVTLTDEQKRVIALYDSLTDQQKAAIDSLLQTMTSGQ